MSGVKASIDLSQLKGFERAMQAAGQNADTLMLDCANALAAEVLSEVKKNTPISKKQTEKRKVVNKKGKEVEREYVVHKGGTLQRGWKTKGAKKIGSICRAEVYNTVKYAPYVEYGHRQTPGRFVPALGKRLKKTWVPGKHMLLRARIAVQKRAAKICNDRLHEFLARIMKEGK